MATLTAEQQLKKLKEKEKALKLKIKREKEKAELQELKKMQKYMKYINADSLKNFIDYALNKEIERKDYTSEKVIKRKITEKDIKIILQNRMKQALSYRELESLKNI